MLKRRGLWITTGFVAGALATGCAHKDPLVGTWSGTTARGSSVIKNTWQFNADGSSSFTLQLVSGPRAPRQVSATGAYTVSGTTLSDTIHSMSEGSHTRTETNAKPETFQYTLNGDTLTLTEAGAPPLTLTRVGQ